MDTTVRSIDGADTQELPFYRPHGGEVAMFEQAYQNRLPVLIKGPTGCGKTRFVRYMAARLGRPLYTVSCHDDLSAADLVGRHLIGDGSTFWSDGPLTRAVREGAICYLDEVVEARKDTTAVLHPLTDHRRGAVSDESVGVAVFIPQASAYGAATVAAPLAPDVDRQCVGGCAADTCQMGSLSRSEATRRRRRG